MPPGRAVAGASLILTLATSAPVAATEDPAPERVELPEIGLAVAFPAGWNVQTVMAPRESWYDVSPEDATPVYAWAGFFAIGDKGRWCGLDRFEDFPWTLEEHATVLERWHVSLHLHGRNGGYEAVELPAGPAWRIDINDELKERSSRLYLLEHEDDHILLTCADTLGSTRDWLVVAESIELRPRSASALSTITATLDAIHAD